VQDCFDEAFWVDELDIYTPLPRCCLLKHPYHAMQSQYWLKQNLKTNLVFPLKAIKSILQIVTSFKL